MQQLVASSPQQRCCRCCRAGGVGVHLVGAPVQQQRQLLVPSSTTQLEQRRRSLLLPPSASSSSSRRQQQQQQQVLVEEDEEQQNQQQQNQQQQERRAGPLGALVDRLLHRAASSLTRGSTTCLACQGSGACSCPLCQGQGLTDASRSRHNQVRHAAQKLKAALHLERADYNVEWLQSNRCRRCHGRGFLPCASCNGLGVRHVRPPPPQH